MRKYITLFCCCTLCFSCERFKAPKTSDALFELNGETLYAAEIGQMMPEGLSSEDSAIYVDNYIKKWVVRNLMYEKANKNVSNIDEIEKMIADYRKSLLIFHYQQELVEQKVKEPTEEQIQAYYDENAERFKLANPLIKGLFLKLPKNAPKVYELKQWITNQTPESLEKIEKYSYQNAVGYEYFGDTWVMLDELQKKIPAIVDTQRFHQKYLAECEDSDFIYLLDIRDYKAANSTEPFELAKDKIKTILKNLAKTKYLNDFEDELYKIAIKNK